MLALKNEKGTQVGEVAQFVLFDLFLAGRSVTMGLNVQKVKEVVEASSVQQVPGGHFSLLGVHDLRGCPVPVFDVGAILSKTPAQAGGAPCERILICELQRGWIGIPVQKARRIVTCPASEFLPPPVGTRLEASRFVTGLIRHDGMYTPVLDIDRLLDMIGIEDKETRDPVQKGLLAGHRVLLVDDSKIILKKLSGLMQELGISVSVAKDGGEALEVMNQSKEPFDLIFTDIEMPVMDGIALARRLKSQGATARIPIVFNSALSNPALISDIEKEKLGEYLVKFDEKLIIAKLKEVLSPG